MRQPARRLRLRTFDGDELPGVRRLDQGAAGVSPFRAPERTGRGGVGTVYRAFDETLERDVALKLLRNERTRNPEYLASLESEASITASINHPHVVKVFSTGLKNGFYYIAMEIVAEGALAEKLQREGPMPEGAVLSLGIQIAEGLRAASERGLLHRDVKPGNILFADAQTVKIADFGLAMPLERVPKNTDIIWGTPEYLAPEKLLRKGEDHRSDIYSLGATLFFCLAGNPPLDATAVWRVSKTQLAVPAPNIQTVAPQVSNAVAAVLKRCLEENPTERYQSYRELIEDLRLAQAPSGSAKVVIPPPQEMEAEAKAPGKKTWLFWAPLAAIVVIMTALSVVLAIRHGTGEKRAVSSTHREASPANSGTAVAPMASPSPSAFGMLTGSVAIGSTMAYDLTALGAIDWAHWNGKYIHKATGGSKISDVTPIGGGDRGVYQSESRIVKWSDGVPVAENRAGHGYIWCRNRENAGWSFNVPAGTTSRTLKVLYGGATNAIVSIKAQLSDHSAPEYSNIQTVLGRAAFVATFTFRAASAEQTLKITLLKLKNSNEDSVDLDAAWLR